MNIKSICQMDGFSNLPKTMWALLIVSIILSGFTVPLIILGFLGFVKLLIWLP